MDQQQRDEIQAALDKHETLSDEQVKLLHEEEDDVDEDAYQAWVNRGVTNGGD